MEYFDIYDIHRIKTDKIMPRGVALEVGDYHLVVHICIFNKEGKMLIQQRQFFKHGFPNRWDLSVGGSATVGETSQEAAQRESFEEIGLTLDLIHVRPSFTINFDRGFNDFYLIEKEVDLHTLHLQYEEVQDAKWASLEEILAMIKEETFVPYRSSLIELCFESRNKLGTLTSEFK